MVHVNQELIEHLRMIKMYLSIDVKKLQCRLSHRDEAAIFLKKYIVSDKT